MIFLSHTFLDKPIVGQIAKTLEQRYGKNKVFYDEWSIQPGDSIIQRMDDGLKNCSYFFFFVSENSLRSRMVELEWQSALVKKTKENIKFIPVRIDRCIIPQILTNTLYIDLFNQGLEIAKRQIIDVINGVNAYQDDTNNFHNVIGYIKEEGKNLVVEFRAEYYMESHSRYLICVDNEEEELDWVVLNKPIGYHNFARGMKDDNGEIFKGVIVISEQESTSPGFPLIVKLTQQKEEKIKVLRLLKAVSNDEYRPIPVKYTIG
jgi:hypothetical protein